MSGGAGEEEGKKEGKVGLVLFVSVSSSPL